MDDKSLCECLDHRGAACDNPAVAICCPDMSPPRRACAPHLLEQVGWMMIGGYCEMHITELKS